MWTLRYADSVLHADIPRLDGTVKNRIRKAIEAKLCIDPVRFGKPLRYSLNHLRCLRVGDYRVLYHLDQTDKTISIVSIGHRRDVYDV